jgi:hypothetical protein
LRIGVLNNLRAGRSDALVSSILGVLDRHPDVLHVETDSARVLPDALAELMRHDIDLLVLNGGDGTLQFALTELLSNPDIKQLPWVAPLRGGRTNMTALDFGGRRNPVKSLEALLQAAKSNRLAERVVRRPVLRISSNQRSDVQYGMFFGAGTIHRAISIVHRMFPKGRSQGVFGAGVVTGTLVGKTALRAKDGVLTPDKSQVRIDDQRSYGGEFTLLIASSLDRLFLRMNPFWGAGRGGVRFTSIASGAPRFGRSVPGIMRGRPGPGVSSENGYESVRANRVELNFDCGYTVDGEIFDPIADEVVTLGADRRITFVRA